MQGLKDHWIEIGIILFSTYYCGKMGLLYSVIFILFGWAISYLFKWK